ncbi:CDP-diacylglycerol--glycerol-3-phosphate 3-phosphatidyltransferase [Agaribacterium haliotis]|uniref:CDP-diacylglycerol--glycerol-3-phosphate 3-phosphatidyltransferase n=1 Tax=Agaribacterium haliotis TaxID=2013869 RepID=UPI001EFC94BB|nr:CDP-diacylglycerol--glycerol-3-phosphate 3-phosphatidyltransferase [Agaribacterium haliotis]
MSLDKGVNFQSLNMVRDELVATIESSAKNLEEYIATDFAKTELLGRAITGARQIIGTFRLLELSSASTLAEELLSVLEHLEQERGSKHFDKLLEVTSNTFFILPRYIEYLSQVQHQVPGLLIPHINALRKLRRQKPLTESHFLLISVPRGLQAPAQQGGAPTKESFRSQIRRARQMYQIGLLGLIREKQINNSVGLMRKGVLRIWKLSGQRPLSTLWWLCDLALQVLVDARMSPLEARKFLFMHIDRNIRQIELNGEQAFESPPPAAQLRELLYLIALSGVKSPAIEALRQACPDLQLPYTERELQKEYAALYGPSAHTISSLAHVLQTELSNAKRTLEGASQSALAIIHDLDSFVSVLNNIAEILGVVGLDSANKLLKDQLNVVKAWKEGGDDIDEAELSSVANSLLYIESVVASLQIPTDHGADAGDPSKRDEHVKSYELSSALAIVLEECLGGLSLTKRALNSFSDSDYDSAHIKNIAKTLDSIRGAMEMLAMDRACFVLRRSVAFVDEVLLANELPAAIDEILETFADVIIAIEYYFDSAPKLEQLDENVLNIAEESLTALGYNE